MPDAADLEDEALALFAQAKTYKQIALCLAQTHDREFTRNAVAGLLRRARIRRGEKEAAPREKGTNPYFRDDRWTEKKLTKPWRKRKRSTPQ
jgi:hypothetical protein